MKELIKYVSLGTLLLFLYIYGDAYSLSFNADCPSEGGSRKRRGRVLMWVLQVFKSFVSQAVRAVEYNLKYNC